MTYSTLTLALGVLAASFSWILFWPILGRDNSVTTPVRSLMLLWTVGAAAVAILLLREIGWLGSSLRRAPEGSQLLLVAPSFATFVKLLGSKLEAEAWKIRVLRWGRALEVGLATALAVMLVYYLTTVVEDDRRLRTTVTAVGFAAILVVMLERQIDRWINPPGSLIIRVMTNRSALIGACAAVGIGVGAALLGANQLVGVGIAMLATPACLAWAGEDAVLELPDD